MSWYGWVRANRRTRWKRVCGPFEKLWECSEALDKLAGSETRCVDQFMTQGAYPMDQKRPQEASLVEKAPEVAGGAADAF